MTERSKRYLDKLRKNGGTIVAVRMTAAQLQTLDRLRRDGESKSACVNRLIALCLAYGGATDSSYAGATDSSYANRLLLCKP